MPRQRRGSLLFASSACVRARTRKDKTGKSGKARRIVTINPLPKGNFLYGACVLRHSCRTPPSSVGFLGPIVSHHRNKNHPTYVNLLPACFVWFMYVGETSSSRGYGVAAACLSLKQGKSKNSLVFLSQVLIFE